MCGSEPFAGRRRLGGLGGRRRLVAAFVTPSLLIPLLVLLLVFVLLVLVLLLLVLLVLLLLLLPVQLFVLRVFAVRKAAGARLGLRTTLLKAARLVWLGERLTVSLSTRSGPSLGQPKRHTTYLGGRSR